MSRLEQRAFEAFAVCAAFVLTSCSLDAPSLDRLPCDDGACIDGYVCHSETNECVLPTAQDCASAAGACSSRTVTGDACENVGSFLPCSPESSDCSAGCRTCTEQRTWSDCSTGCGELGTATQCGSCTDDCTALPNVELVTCDPSPAGFQCSIARCVDGFVDAAFDEPGCECRPSEDGREICDGRDNDCDGTVDDFGSSGALDLLCASTYPGAMNVTAWACNSACTVATCATGHFDIDGLPDNGCEYVCDLTGSEICDGIDNDCSGTIDDVPLDALTEECTTSHPEAIAVTEWACSGGACVVSRCRPGYRDADSQIRNGCEAGCVVSNDGIEICDNEDNDCNGLFDEPNAVGCIDFFQDKDKDGVGRNDKQCLCAMEGLYTASVGGDCDDEPEGCGNLCFPGNSAQDVCDGFDQNCDGTDGEMDPLLGAACDGPGADRCEDEIFVGCDQGSLFCGLECVRQADGSCVSNDIFGCDLGNATCSAGPSQVQDCTSASDNDCDGLITCADSDCLQEPACMGFEDRDGDGYTTAPTATPDCDDTIPTCTTDCSTNSDAAGEPDCVERFCGSDPNDATSSCRVVTSSSALNAAINGANSNAGRDFILMRGNLVISGSIPDLTDEAGVELRQELGSTVEIRRGEPLIDSAGNASIFEYLNVRHTRASESTIVLRGVGSSIARSTLTHEAGISVASVRLIGAESIAKDLQIVGNAERERGILVEGLGSAVSGVSISVGAGFSGLRTGIEVAGVSQVRLSRNRIGLSSSTVGAYTDHGIFVHGDGPCGSNPSIRPTETLLIDNIIAGGTAAPASERAGILLCDADATVLVGNLLTQLNHNAVIMNGCGRDGNTASGTLIAHSTIDAGTGTDAIELTGADSQYLCLRDNWFRTVNGAVLRTMQSTLNGSTVPGCDALSSELKNAYDSNTLCAGGCDGCTCLPGGDGALTFGINAAPSFELTDLSEPNAYCPDHASLLVDAASSAPLPSPAADRNGAAFGLVSGPRADLGAREQGGELCVSAGE